MTNLSHVVTNVKQDAFWRDRDWTAYKEKDIHKLVHLIQGRLINVHIMGLLVESRYITACVILRILNKVFCMATDCNNRADERVVVVIKW